MESEKTKVVLTQEQKVAQVVGELNSLITLGIPGRYGGMEEYGSMQNNDLWVEESAAIREFAMSRLKKYVQG